MPMKWWIHPITSSTSTDGKVVEPTDGASFGSGVNIVSNTYENGQGVIQFDGPVTRIGEYAFRNLSQEGRLKTMVLPESCLNIGLFAFHYQSSLEEIQLPGGLLTIGTMAFYYCQSLTRIELPESLIQIDDYVFCNCKSLHEVTIPQSLEKMLGGVFAACTGMERFYGKFADATGRALINGGTLLAFAPSGLSTYTVPDGITAIAEGVFSSFSNMEEIILPDGLQSIGMQAFSNCTGLTEIIIPESVTTLGSGVFRSCSNLTNVNIPLEMTTIPAETFSSCTSLPEITIPEGVTTIESYAFQGCRELRSVTIPSSVNKIGVEAFFQAEALESLVLEPVTPPTGGDKMFDYTNDCPIYVPAQSVDAYKAAEYWSTYADRIMAAEGETQPSNEIWYTTSDGNTVEYYTHPNHPVDFSVVSNTYENGKGVMTFDGPVTRISYMAFVSKSTLTSITLPDTVTSIDEEAFSSCTSLAWPDIPESVTSIGNSAFYGCSAFTNVVIPDNVTGFGSSIFQNCQNLESISGQYASADGRCLVVDGELNSFAYAGLGGEYVFPQGVTTIGQGALRNSHYEGSLSFASDITSVGKESFAYAYYIKSLELGEGLDSVSDGAFIMCGADSLILPATLTKIGNEAFAASFDYLKFLSTTPPEASGLIFETQYLSDYNFPIYVPAISLNAYKTAEYWSTYASRIQPIGGSTITASKYLTFTSEGTSKLSLANSNDNAPVLYYSTDAQNWTQWDYSELTFSANAPLYICGDNPDGFSFASPEGTNNKSSSFAVVGEAPFSVSGDVMSLLDMNADVITIPSAGCFMGLFGDCVTMVSAPALPATSLTASCYSYMFNGCTSLVSAPELPATVMAENCYSGMFWGCESLTTAPALPATTLADYCYENMFYQCSSLTEAPELPATTLATQCYQVMFADCTSLSAAPELPATNLASGCYNMMFSGCTKLEEAPELPATTLASNCYWDMFSNCTSLTSAPTLPAATLPSGAYGQMFHGCSNLSFVTCLATDISASDCLYNWLYGVADNGTFVKAANMTDWPRSASGIPESWNVQDASSSDFDGRWEALRNNDDPTSVAFVALFEGSNLDLYIIAWGQHLSGTYSYEDGTIIYDITAGLQAYTDVSINPDTGEMESSSWQAGNLDPTTLTLSDGYDWYSMSDEDLSNLQDFAQFPFVIQDNGTAISSLVGIQDLVFSKMN